MKDYIVLIAWGFNQRNSFMIWNHPSCFIKKTSTFLWLRKPSVACPQLPSSTACLAHPLSSFLVSERYIYFPWWRRCFLLSIDVITNMPLTSCFDQEHFLCSFELICSNTYLKLSRFSWFLFPLHVNMLASHLCFNPFRFGICTYQWMEISSNTFLHPYLPQSSIGYGSADHQCLLNWYLLIYIFILLTIVYIQVKRGPKEFSNWKENSELYIFVNSTQNFQSSKIKYCENQYGSWYDCKEKQSISE